MLFKKKTNLKNNTSGEMEEHINFELIGHIHSI
jgi:hypothetical protein